MRARIGWMNHRPWWPTVIALVLGLTMPLPSKAQPTCSSTTPLTCGETLAGTLSSVGEFDCFTFTGNAGEAISVTTQETAGVFQSCWTLFAPGGGSLGTVCGQAERALPEDGTYTIEVSDQGANQSGSYDVNLVFVSATASACATDVGCGATVPGQLDLVGESDTYAFAGLVGDTVSITAQETGGGLSACWELYDPTGLSLDFACGQDERTLAVSGTYIVRVYDNADDQPGAYDLNFVVVSDTASTCAQPIGCGQTLAGSVGAVGESDTYRFASEAGESVSITGQETAGGLAACWELYDPQGIAIANACGQAEKRLAVAGDYTIRVHDQFESETGNYDLNLVFVSDTGSQCGVPIGCGVPAVASITTIAESDAYQFAAVGGEAVSITAQETAGFLAACWELYDPGGISLGFVCGQGEKTLAVTGNYTIRVYDTGDAETGTYDLAVVVVSDTANNCGTVIPCGSTIASGLAVKGESDSFVFAAAAGDAMSITAQETGGFLSACWELYDPTGISLGFTCGQSEKTAAIAGNYTLRVYDMGDGETGTYDLNVVVVSATAGNCATPIACGETKVGALTLKGDSDSYVFSADTGEAVSVTAQETGGFISACWEMYDPTGISLGFTCGQNEKTLPVAGDYTIRVYDQGESETGTYDLNLVVLSSTAHNCGEPIGCGQPLTRSIDLKGESDTFAFTAFAGQTFPISTEGTGGSINACWEVYDPVGASLGGRCGSEDRTAAADGIYTIRAYDQGEDSTGSYVVTVCTPPTTTTSSTTSTTIAGSTTTSTLPGVDDDRPLDGKKLILKDDATNADKRRLKLLSKDARLDVGAGPGTANDPTLVGATLRISTASGDAFDTTYALDRTGWRPLKAKKPERGWKFTGDGAVRKVIVKANKLLKVVGKGGSLEHTLGSDPNPVSVVLTIGARPYCLTFGGDTTFDPGRRFKATRSLAPSSCPEEGSASGAFVE